MGNISFPNTHHLRNLHDFERNTQHLQKQARLIKKSLWFSYLFGLILKLTFDATKIQNYCSMTNFFQKLVNYFSDIAQFKISTPKREKIIMFVNLCKSDITERHFSKTSRRFIRLKRRVSFPNRRFGFLCFRAESSESTRLWQSIGDAPKFGGL